MKESEGHKGYYVIPQEPNYAINLNGSVVNLKTGQYLSGSRNPDGYYNYRLTAATGEAKTYGRHRLMGMTFKDPGVPIDNLVINHLNGVKGDDWLDNLEWSTYQGNAEHAGAMGLTEKCRPISVLDTISGNVTKYPSCIAAAKELGLTKDAVLWRVKTGETRVFPEKKQYRFGHSDEPWFNVEDIVTALLLNGTRKSVLCRDVRSGKIKRFEKISDFAASVGISPSTATLWVGKNNQPVLPGFLQLKWETDPSPWREVTDPLLELDEQSGSRVIVVTNLSANTVDIYPRAKDCADTLRLKTSTLHMRLKAKGPFGDLRFEYYSEYYKRNMVSCTGNGTAKSS